MNQKQKDYIARSKKAVRVDGIYYHGAMCECRFCSMPPVAMRYARVAQRRRG